LVEIFSIAKDSQTAEWSWVWVPTCSLLRVCNEGSNDFYSFLPRTPRNEEIVATDLPVDCEEEAAQGLLETNHWKRLLNSRDSPEKVWGDEREHP